MKRILSRPALLLVALCLLVGVRTLTMDFVWDDNTHIVDNVTIRSLRNVPLMFTAHVDKGAEGAGGYSPYYRPVFILSLALDYAIWGLQPFGFRLTDLALHIAVVLIFYALARRLLGMETAAFAAAALYAVHPAHVEVLGIACARVHSLAALLMLLSFISYLSYRDTARFRFAVASLGSLLAGMMSNEVAVTVVPLIVLYELLYPSAMGRKKYILLAAAVAVVASYLAVRSRFVDTVAQRGDLGERLLMSLRVYGEYLRLFIFPFVQKTFYDLRMGDAVLSAGNIIAAGLLAAFGSGLFAMRRSRIVLFSAAWFVIVLSPVSNLPYPMYPVPMAERYLYIASMGLCLLAGVGWERLRTALAAGGRSRRVSWAAVAIIVVIGLFICKTIARLEIYDGDDAFVPQSLAEAPESEYVLTYASYYYMRNGNPVEAERMLRRVLGKNPGSWTARADLGRVFMDQKRYREAEEEYLKAIAMQPNADGLYYMLGILYYESGAFPAAAQAFLDALRFDRESDKVHNSLAATYAEMEDFERALHHAEEALRVNPEYEHARKNIEQIRREMTKK